MADPISREVIGRPAPGSGPSPLPRGTGASDTEQAKTAVGAGSIGQLGAPSDLPASLKMSDGARSNADGPMGPQGAPALSPPRTEFSLADIGIEISVLFAKMDDAQSNVEEQGLKLDDSQRQEAFKRSTEKIQEAAKKIHEAQHKQKSLDILITVGKVLAGVAAVALTITTCGAAAPLAIALIAYTVVDTSMTIADSISQAEGGPRLALDALMQEGFTQAAKACGDDDKKAAEVGQWCAFGVQAAVALVTITVSAANLVSVVRGTTSGGAMLTKLGTTGFKALKLTGIASQAVSSATQAASGGMKISIGQDTAGAEKAQADKVRMDEVAAALGETIRNTLDRLALIAADLSSGMKSAAEIVSKVGETNIAVAAGGGNAMV
jgi:hypothetical protein